MYHHQVSREVHATAKASQLIRIVTCHMNRAANQLLLYKPTAKQRYSYIRTAKLMTEPLITAYNKMININMHTRPQRRDTYQDVMPLYDNIPSNTPILPPPILITHNIPLSPAQATEIEALFPQSSTTTAMP